LTLKLIQNKTIIESKQISNLDTITDVKFQDIIYYYWDGKKLVKSNQQVKIDFLGAMREMENIDHTFELNFIGFQNNATGQYVQFIRLGENYWYVDSPINDQHNWEGYLWAGYGNIQEIANLVKLFFKEGSWFESISWKMRRYSQ
jgi:hypothetical protein